MNDVFGFTPQSLQGADILASSTTHPYLVVAPDLFDGEALNLEDFPFETPEGKAKAAHFRANVGTPPKLVSKTWTIMPELKSKYPEVQKWGAVGFCLGGKVVALTSGPETHFSAAIQSSPGGLDPADAERVTIPMAVLASAGEDATTVGKFGDSLKVKKTISTFGSQVHGWMTAR